jgi:transcription factor TFIIIB component B''
VTRVLAGVWGGWVGVCRKLNSQTYSNRSPAERWSKEDTEKYYKALTMFGLDFTMIGYHFPNRNRRQLKNK